MYLNPLVPTQAYGFIEVFGGEAWVSKCMRVNGVTTATFDIRLGSPKQDKMDAMDILSDAGFAYLSCMILEGVLFWLLEWSTMVSEISSPIIFIYVSSISRQTAFKANSTIHPQWTFR